MKCFPSPWDAPDLTLLAGDGTEVVVAEDETTRHRALRDAEYIFDCRVRGAPHADLGFYRELSDVGVCVQGSEIDFGIPFVAGVNDAALKDQRLVHVASCNTHATSAILRIVAGAQLQELDEADLVVVRRSEDVGSHERLVAANVVARHRDQEAGTHHAVEARKVFSTIGATADVVSSDVTTPSQLMHAVRFCVRTRSKLIEETLQARFEDDPYVATTEKFDSNRVFELGRRHGFHGRIFAHAVVVANNLLVDKNRVRGWAFVPQEGNTLVSSLEAFLRFREGRTGEGREHEATGAAVKSIRDRLIRSRW